MTSQFIEMTSVWSTGAHAQTYPSLDGDRHVDVAIVGGGIAGVTAAYLLKQAGKTVALVERRRCGGGETGRSSAHVTAVTDTPLSALVERLGPDRAQAVWHAGFAALSRLRANVRDERINCDFAWVRGWLHASPAAQREQVRQELSREAAVAAGLGIEASYFDDVAGIGGPGVCFENQARIHPLRYLEVLLDRIHGDGSYVFENTSVDALEEEPWAVRAGAHRITAEYVVVATHLPLAVGVAADRQLESDLRLTRTYVVSGLAPRGPIDEGLYWEHRDAPYEYLRVDRHENYDEVLFGGQDHPSGADDQCLDARERLTALERRLRARVPGVRITRRWSGRLVETRDGLPYIGEIAPGRFIATGFGGNGMTFGTLAGMMAADAAVGRLNPWSELFDVRRRRVLSGAWPVETPADGGSEAPLRTGAAKPSSTAARRDRPAAVLNFTEFFLTRAQ